MDTYVKRAEDLEGLNTNLMPALLEAVLGDYNSNLPDARDAEVLNVMAVIITRMGVSRRIIFVLWLCSADWVVARF